MHNCRTPALLTGTSTEYLGKRPFPKVIRQRSAVFVLGPEGVGKTRVARRIAGEGARHLDTAALQQAILRRVRMGHWSRALIRAKGLVLDGPVWLRNRHGVVELLVQLLRQRGEAGRRTLVVQSDLDGSIDELIRAMPCGSMVVLGLRFPKGRRGRMRFARRMCDELGCPAEAARGTDQLAPWRYDAVIDALSRWPHPVPTADASVALQLAIEEH